MFLELFQNSERICKLRFADKGRVINFPSVPSHT